MVNFNEIASKWQQRWEKSQIFKVTEDYTKKKYTIIEMYPYPSSHGLHMGHARNYCIGDAFARYKRMCGFNVLYPMGYDSFGLPAENAAIQAKTHPKKFTEEAISNFISQQKRLGLSYDWSRKLASHYPEYYKWNQYFFLKFYEKGLVYRKKAPVNWCPRCDTVLANEQVHNGKCWRHKDTEVEQKNLEQWFLKITDYAEELLNDVPKLQWPERIKLMQENWIGKSAGVEIFFKLEGTDKILPAYTTRCDTIYSVTFVVIAPEHPLVMELVQATKYEKETKEILKKIAKQTEIERTTPEGKDKIGCFLGKYAINPVNGERVPVYVANFALMYGTGIVMADAHDQRDFEFARKYNIPLKFVISEDGVPINAEKASRAYLSDGMLFDSGEFSGMHNREALPLMADWLEKNGWGKKTVNYKLRDWLISRQRYWGTPIPFIHCDNCGVVPVLEKDLPVLLPEKVKFGKGNPLATNKDFVNTKCPKCRGKARRETDTMDTFFDSSWYFLRYCDNKNDKEPFDKKKLRYWMPVDQYIGGAEHACMHLIYARFFIKVLRDLKFLDFNEPFTKLFNQGMLHKGGFVMSKSRGNVVTQDEIEKKYGIDTARLFLLFLASPDKDVEWSDEGIEGSFRFLNKLYSLAENYEPENSLKDRVIVSKTNKTIRDVADYIENFQYNLALISIMDFVNHLYKYKLSISKKVFNESLNKLLPIISPFTPHLAEEMWEKLENKSFVSLEKWPGYDEKKIDEKAEASELLINKTINDINNVLALINLKAPKKITLIVSPEWKYGFFNLIKEELKNTRDVKILVKTCMAKKGLKEHGKDIAKLIPALLKDASKIPETLLEQKTEIGALNSMKDSLEKTFKAEITLVKAEDSKEQKANQALPGKPSIVII